MSNRAARLGTNSPLLSLFVFLAGVALLWGGLHLLDERFRFLERAMRVQGRVVGIGSAGTGKDAIGREVVTVQLVLPDRTTPQYRPSAVSKGTYKLGDRMVMFYDPHERTAVADTFFDLYGGVAFALGTGAAMVLVGGAVLIGAARRRVKSRG